MKSNTNVITNYSAIPAEKKCAISETKLPTVLTYPICQRKSQNSLKDIEVK